MQKWATTLILFLASLGVGGFLFNAVKGSVPYGTDPTIGFVLGGVAMFGIFYLLMKLVRGGTASV